MPRFYIDTFDGKAVFDDEGYELEDRSSIRGLVRQILLEVMLNETTGASDARLRADVRDEMGTLIATARLSFSIDEFGKL